MDRQEIRECDRRDARVRAELLADRDDPPVDVRPVSEEVLDGGALDPAIPR